MAALPQRGGPLTSGRRSHGGPALSGAFLGPCRRRGGGGVARAREAGLSGGVGSLTGRPSDEGAALTAGGKSRRPPRRAVRPTRGRQSQEGARDGAALPFRHRAVTRPHPALMSLGNGPPLEALRRQGASGGGPFSRGRCGGGCGGGGGGLRRRAVVARGLESRWRARMPASLVRGGGESAAAELRKVPISPNRAESQGAQ